MIIYLRVKEKLDQKNQNFVIDNNDDKNDNLYIMSSLVHVPFHIKLITISNP